MAKAIRSAEELDGTEPPEEAIPVLVEAHGGRLYSLGLRFCGNREDARDLVQDTFLQAFRKWHQFEGRSSASTWLYRIAARICQRSRRRKSGQPKRLQSLDELRPFAEPSLAVVPDGPAAERLREEARREVEGAIASLPTSFRMPFVLKEVVGFSVAHTAEILGLREGTVKSRLHRARIHVRSALEGTLPRRPVPPALFSRQVCLDLLRAKQESLDRGTRFEFPDAVICERCAEFFATLDLTREICQSLSRGELPAELRALLLDRVQAAG